MKEGLSRIFAISAGVALCLSFWSPTFAQSQTEEEWQRVFTSEEFVLDVNTASVTFQPDHVLRAVFRLVYSKSETFSASRGVTYKTLLETIEFKLNERSYRVYESSLLNAAGKIVQSNAANPSEEWKTLKDGGMFGRMFAAASSSPPLGLWKVTGYRYADGSPAQGGEPFELSKLLGTFVRLGVDTAEVETKRCPSPAYESRQLTDKESLKELGASLESMGFKTKSIDAVAVKCEASGWSPPQSLLIRLPESDRMLTLWEGVFLELKRERF